MKTKALSGVVSLLLLVVVSVVSLAGFNIWYDTYQSGVLSKAEIKLNSGAALTIDSMLKTSHTNASIYLKSGTGTFQIINNIKFENQDCTFDESFVPDTFTLVTIECSSIDSGEREIVIYTSGGIFSKHVFIK